MTNEAHSLSTPLSRRAVLGALGGGAAALAMPHVARAAGDKPTLVTSIRSLSNPYHAV